LVLATLCLFFWCCLFFHPGTLSFPPLACDPLPPPYLNGSAFVLSGNPPPITLFWIIGVHESLCFTGFILSSTHPLLNRLLPEFNFLAAFFDWRRISITRFLTFRLVPPDPVAAISLRRFPSCASCLTIGGAVFSSELPEF